MKGFFSKLIFWFGFPEMRMFWVFLPFLAAILVINLVYLPYPFSLLSAALLVLVCGVILVTAISLGNANFLSKTEQRDVRYMVGAFEDAIVVYDQDFTITYFNPPAEKLFALKKEEVMGKKIRPQDAEKAETQLLARVIFPSLAPAIIPVSAPGDPNQVVELSFTDPTLSLRTTTAILRDEGGTTLGFMKIIRDHTREVELIKSKEEFIAVASHQLRTPVTEVDWGLQALAGDESLNENAKALVANSLASSRKLLKIVEDLLSISKIEEGRFGYNFEPVEPLGFFEKILEEEMPRVNRSGIRLYFDKPKEPLPNVLLDQAKISMVVSNLIDNAIRYNVPNGEITVSLKKSAEGPFIEVAVKDTGIGIPPEEMGKVFGKFFRSSNAVKFQTDGSGLGLYIAKNIVQAHGGNIRAESELNRGTTFAFTLPRDPALVAQKAPAAR